MPEPRLHTTGLTRQIDKPDLFRMTASDDDDGLTIEGYWAVLNNLTTIDSWEGSFREQSAPGAFKRTLRERTPIMQFDHGSHPLLGSLPLGRWTESFEDDHGAFSRGRLSDNWLVQPFRDAIRDEGVKGMSFRFQILRDAWTEADGVTKVKDADVLRRIYDSSASEDELLVRTIKEAKVSEAGPVVWPAYEATSVGVRSKVVIDLGRLNEPAQRAELARAVLLADDIERSSDDPPSSADTAPAEQPTEDTTDDPQTSADAPGEQPSTPTPEADARAATRTALRELRAYVNSIKEGASNGGH